MWRAARQPLGDASPDSGPGQVHPGEVWAGQLGSDEEPEPDDADGAKGEARIGHRHPAELPSSAMPHNPEADCRAGEQAQEEEGYADDAQDQCSDGVRIRAWTAGRPAFRDATG